MTLAMPTGIASSGLTIWVLGTKTGGITTTIRARCAENHAQACSPAGTEGASIDMDPTFRELLADFLSEGFERTDAVEQHLLDIASEDSAGRREAVIGIKRQLHTLKGNAGMMGLGALQQLAHALEDRVEVVDVEDQEGLAAAVDQLLAGVDQMREHLNTLTRDEAEEGGAGQDDSAEDDPADYHPELAASGPDGEPSDTSAEVLLDSEARGRASTDTTATESAKTAPPSPEKAKPEIGAPGTQGDGRRAPAPVPSAASADDDGIHALGFRASDGRIRISYAKIDELVELQAEALVLRTRLAEAIGAGANAARATTIRHARPDASDADGVRGDSDEPERWKNVAEAWQALEKSLDRMQARIIDLGMVPLEGLFRPLGRIVHDESRREGKRVELKVRGGETPIDKALLEVAGEALGHLVRNAIIHGIETPDVRAAQGKPPVGTVDLRAAVVSGEVRIEVADDGGGVDLDAIERRMSDRARAQTPGEDPFAVVFEAGITSRGDADMSAGRGVGLSAVKASVERVGGRVELRTAQGKGSSFQLALPLTTTILRSLLLRADQETYALPLSSVTESLHLDPKTLHTVNQAGVLRWRGRVVPLLDLGLAFETADKMRERGFAIVIETGGRARALVVDDIAGIRDIVVKSLDPIVGHPIGISGSTILGDGRVIMILDPVTLATIPSAASPAS